jgi:hypothetical protein
MPNLKQHTGEAQGEAWLNGVAKSFLYLPKLWTEFVPAIGKWISAKRHISLNEMDQIQRESFRQVHQNFSFSM